MTRSHGRSGLATAARVLPVLALAGLVVAWPTAASADTADDARAAAERFARTGVSTYVVDVEQSCFCAFADDVRVVRVFVADGRIARVQGWTGYPPPTATPDTTTSGPAPPAGPVFDADRIPREHRWARRYVPLPRAFRSIAATAGRADETRARFAARSGWPRSFRVDRIVEAVDDEFTITWRRVPDADAAAGVAPGARAQGVGGASSGNGDVLS